MKGGDQRLYSGDITTRIRARWPPAAANVCTVPAGSRGGLLRSAASSRCRIARRAGPTRHRTLPLIRGGHGREPGRPVRIEIHRSITKSAMARDCMRSDEPTRSGSRGDEGRDLRSRRGRRRRRERRALVGRRRWELVPGEGVEPSGADAHGTFESRARIPSQASGQSHAARSATRP